MLILCNVHEIFVIFIESLLKKNELTIPGNIMPYLRKSISNLLFDNFVTHDLRFLIRVLWISEINP